MIKRLARSPRRTFSMFCLISTLSTMGFITVNKEALDFLPFDVKEVESSIPDYFRDFLSRVDSEEVTNQILEVVQRINKNL
ncbi:hypothetical protein [Vibrio sp. 10N.239.312.D08]|uniref:hypothetical protein n=1 Tax=Vibrio sp. 10N.239.312.D08 TaxID=3229978 RepID=UPI00354C7483